MSCDPKYKELYDQFVFDCHRFGVITNTKSVILPGDDISWYQPEMFDEGNPATASTGHKIEWSRLFRDERRLYQKQRRRK